MMWGKVLLANLVLIIAYVVALKQQIVICFAPDCLYWDDGRPRSTEDPTDCTYKAKVGICGANGIGCRKAYYCENSIRLSDKILEAWFFLMHSYLIIKFAID